VISRDSAANIRYDVLVGGQNKGEVARAYDITVSAVERIVTGRLVPPPDERVVTRPNYTPRNRKLTPEQRVHIAHLICYGATMQGLADTYGVQVRSIQHIKEGYTARVGEASRNSRPHKGDMSHNLVAEARYRHTVRKEPIAMIAASLFVNYKNLHRAIQGKTFKTAHKLKLSLAGEALDAESQSGRVVHLFLYGADEGFISDTTDVPRDAVRSLVEAYTEAA